MLIRLTIAGFEVEEENHEPRNASSLQQLKRTRKYILPLEPPERKTAHRQPDFSLMRTMSGF